jgi:enoyl-CoA hydratase/carnithine racemase
VEAVPQEMARFRQTCRHPGRFAAVPALVDCGSDSPDKHASTLRSFKSMGMFETRWENSGAIALVRLDRPPANAFGSDEVDELDALIDRLAAAPSVRAVLFHSRARFFSAGADIGFMRGAAGAEGGVERLAHFAARLQAAFAKLEALPIVSGSAISGICLGGGLELALACDFRIAESNAVLGLPEARIGLLPAGGGTQRLTKVAGSAVAKRLILTGDSVSGEEAKRLGIVHDVVAPGAATDALLALVRTSITAPRKTLAAIKRCIALAPSPAGYQAEVEGTRALQGESETQALITAFVERSRKKKVAV